MSQLKIYKASAGSGKTFRLALEYLKIALDSEWNYKNILAVTFTNKATTEMKERVIEELYVLANEQPSAYLPILADEMKLSSAAIADRARKSLKRILHDYSRFSISTIDSFFQRVIKSFNRELGINAAYQVDLEDKLILEEAVDELLVSIEDNPALLAWLKKFANEKIREGGGWNLKNDILKLGVQIYNETFKALNQTLHEKINDKQFITNYKKELNSLIYQFESTLKQIGKKGLQTMQEHGVSVDDFKFKKTSASTSFQRLADFNIDSWPGKRATEAADDPEVWTTQTAKANVKEAAASLQPLLHEAVTFYFKKLHDYNSAKLISSQLYTLGILVDLQAMVRQVTQEKGVVLISESGTLLKSIIDDSDAPFIYEKTGVFYNHFMIDEFQDTSGLQWGNFRPLITNALAEGNLGMLVGDVKQAIYRWRNGNWDLLGGEVSKQFSVNGVTEETLQKNWRSTGNVIRFNNSIFQILPQLFQQNINNELEENRLKDTEMAGQIELLYGESLQQIANTKLLDEGAIRMRFFEKPKDDEQDELRETILNELVEQIREVQSIGAKAREIAVLVRKKDEAKLVADRLLHEKAKADSNYNFNILSSESLFVKNSAAVGFVLALYQLLADPNDDVALALANHLYYNELFDQLQHIGRVPDLSVSSSPQLTIGFDALDKPDTTSWFEKRKEESNLLSDFLTSAYFSESLGGRNIQEIAFKICELFNLFSLNEELAYLQAFIDQVAAFMRNRTADIAAFLSWWEEQGQKATIAVSEELDAIRIQTIHKAKGLEYNYVFIPFCDWKTEVAAQHAPILWCQPKLPPFNQLELVPVKYEKRMGESIFFQEYFQEKINYYIDNLNMLYVAFTRARTALFTWSVTTGKFGNMADVLRHAMELADRMPPKGDPSLFCSLSDHFTPESSSFSYGEISASAHQEQVKENGLVLNEFRFADFHDYLKLRKRNEHFFVADDLASTKINKGRVFHEVLARISTTSDVENAVGELVLKGLIQTAEKDQMLQQLHELVADPEVKSWFDGSFRVLNERSVLTGTELKRPDRIMINDKEVIVVDYKSGEKELDKYHYQVRTYVNQLKGCGYPNVSGYIWYTQTNKRVKVE
ncbi:UvrD-helicase domain-containing protein [Sunxiuqinia dokdonensis]|uniref:DNA 3'-5' helicase n=1 Tax=Sunxiuqinia dokdonensis TaxID=1409788 RepID=A0A0L8V3J2_9BACT|nr:UvrD-helicase domain-containing protein [Sunxiuqinia dokdonensis]KOH42772.1 exodeoxyribonuclease V [Sunxiuqinia dokdonensis]